MKKTAKFARSAIIIGIFMGILSPALALLGQRTGSWMFRLAVGLYTMMVVYNIASIDLERVVYR